MSNDVVLDYLMGNFECSDVKMARRVSSEMLAKPLPYFRKLMKSQQSFGEIAASNIPQFSDPTVGMYRVPTILMDSENPLTFVELGERTFKSQSLVAMTKYGENHGKLATYLGLAMIEKHNNRATFVITEMGKVFCSMDEEQKGNLLQRLCYRIPVIQRMAASDEPFRELDDCLSVLSESTRRRRYANVRDLFEFAIDE